MKSLFTKILISIIALIAVVSIVSAINGNSKKEVDSNQAQQVQTEKAKIKQVNQPKIEAKTEPIPFETKEQNDSTLNKGQTKVSQEGQNGTKTLTYEVTYTGGKETARKQIKEEVTVKSINKIVLVGTKEIQTTPTTTTTNSSKQDGYTNVDGNWVPSPSSNPAGATAKCRDGTYSYSQHRSGTCSHHGGVLEWL